MVQIQNLTGNSLPIHLVDSSNLATRDLTLLSLQKITISDHEYIGSYKSLNPKAQAGLISLIGEIVPINPTENVVEAADFRVLSRGIDNQITPQEPGSAGGGSVSAVKIAADSGLTSNDVGKIGMIDSGVVKVYALTGSAGTPAVERITVNQVSALSTLVHAYGTFAFSGIPADGDTVTLNAQGFGNPAFLATFTFKNSPAGPTDVQIVGTVAGNVTNLNTAILGLSFPMSIIFVPTHDATSVRVTVDAQADGGTPTTANGVVKILASSAAITTADVGAGGFYNNGVNGIPATQFILVDTVLFGNNTPVTFKAGVDYTPGANTSLDAAAIAAIIPTKWFNGSNAYTATAVGNVITVTRPINGAVTIGPNFSMDYNGNPVSGIVFANVSLGTNPVTPAATKVHAGKISGVSGGFASIDGSALLTGIASEAISVDAPICGTNNGRLKNVSGSDRTLGKAVTAAAAPGDTVVYLRTGA